MKKIILMLVFCITSLGFAQEKVSGTVTDGSNAPIAGVTVQVKGAASSVSTDFDGKFKIKNVTTEQIIECFNQKTGKNLTPYFDMYLRTKHLPTLQYQLTPKNNTVELRFRYKDANGSMPIKAGYSLQMYEVITPTSEWQTKVFQKMEGQEFKIATELFYIKAEKI